MTSDKHLLINLVAESVIQGLSLPLPYHPHPHLLLLLGLAHLVPLVSPGRLSGPLKNGQQAAQAIP